MITKITKEEYPDIWNVIVDDIEDLCAKHRKYESFYARPVYKIDPEYFPDNPEIHGCWQSDETILWSDSWGLEDKPTVLVRVEQVPVTTYEWKKVENISTEELLEMYPSMVVKDYYRRDI